MSSWRIVFKWLCTGCASGQPNPWAFGKTDAQITDLMCEHATHSSLRIASVTASQCNNVQPCCARLRGVFLSRRGMKIASCCSSSGSASRIRVRSSTTLSLGPHLGRGHTISGASLVAYNQRSLANLKFSGGGADAEGWVLFRRQIELGFLAQSSRR